jgi:hypothetical protein
MKRPKALTETGKLGLVAEDVRTADGRAEWAANNAEICEGCLQRGSCVVEPCCLSAAAIVVAISFLAPIPRVF